MAICPAFGAFVQPASPLVWKVLAVAICLAPARCGAANCPCDRKDVKKEKAGNGRYNLRFDSAKRKTPLKLSPLGPPGSSSSDPLEPVAHADRSPWTHAQSAQSFPKRTLSVANGFLFAHCTALLLTFHLPPFLSLCDLSHQHGD